MRLNKYCTQKVVPKAKLLARTYQTTTGSLLSQTVDELSNGPNTAPKILPGPELLQYSGFKIKIIENIMNRSVNKAVPVSVCHTHCTGLQE